jgi:hypothetical protein
MQLSRREAILRLALLMGASFITPRLRATDFGTSATPPTGYTPADLALLDEIGDTIIPPTDVPGAKAIGIGAFMARMVTDCYRAEEQSAFRAGMAAITRDYRARFGEDYVGGAAANRTLFLNEISASLRPSQREKEPAGSTAAQSQYFRTMRELTILGYFTSEVVATNVLPWIEVPGSYDGNVPYRKRAR